MHKITQHMVVGYPDHGLPGYTMDNPQMWIFSIAETGLLAEADTGNLFRGRGAYEEVL